MSAKHGMFFLTTRTPPPWRLRWRVSSWKVARDGCLLPAGLLHHLSVAFLQLTLHSLVLPHCHFGLPFLMKSSIHMYTWIFKKIAFSLSFWDLTMPFFQWLIWFRSSWVSYSCPFSIKGALSPFRFCPSLIFTCFP